MSESDGDKDFPGWWKGRKVRVGKQGPTYTGSVFIHENDLRDEMLTELWLVKTKVRGFVRASREGMSQGGKEWNSEEETPFPLWSG